MTTSATAALVYQCDLSSESTWIQLYPTLQTLAKKLVYSFGLACWRGQEEDLANDIVQEVVRRILERSRRAEQGKASPILSPEGMLKIAVCNYCKDLRRQDRRIMHTDYCWEFESISASQAMLAELAIEEVDQELLFQKLAHEIAKFPTKQRKALLIDLASRMHFASQPTPLQAAFLQVNINLQEYQHCLHETPQERARHVALLSLAYKRLTSLPWVQQGRV